MITKIYFSDIKDFYHSKLKDLVKKAKDKSEAIQNKSVEEMNRLRKSIRTDSLLVIIFILLGMMELDNPVLAGLMFISASLHLLLVFTGKKMMGKCKSNIVASTGNSIMSLIIDLSIDEFTVEDILEIEDIEKLFPEITTLKNFYNEKIVSVSYENDKWSMKTEEGEQFYFEPIIVRDNPDCVVWNNGNIILSRQDMVKTNPTIIKDTTIEVLYK